MSTMGRAPYPPSLLEVDGRVVALAELATDRRARARGLLGRSHIDGALVLLATRSVHTIAMTFTIDVALCDAALVVVAALTLPPGRVTRPRRGIRVVIEAEAGAFARWGLQRGSQIGLVEPTDR